MRVAINRTIETSTPVGDGILQRGKYFCRGTSLQMTPFMVTVLLSSHF